MSAPESRDESGASDGGGRQPTRSPETRHRGFNDRFNDVANEIGSAPGSPTAEPKPEMPADAAPTPTPSDPPNGRSGDPLVVDGIAANQAVETAAPIIQSQAPARGALLSLKTELHPPHSFVKREFYYRGSAQGVDNLTLTLNYESRRTGRMVTTAVAAGLLLLFWWLRSISRMRRWTLLICSLLGPLAVGPFVDASLDSDTRWHLSRRTVWRPVVGRALVRNSAVHRDPALVRSGLSTTAMSLLLTTIIGVSVTPAGADDAVQLLQPTGTLNHDGLFRPHPDDVIIPYAEGSDLSTADKLFVPQDVFLRLWRAAHPELQQQPKPPVDAILASALYGAELDVTTPAAPTIKVTARFLVENLTDHAVSLELPIGRVAVETAEVAGNAGSCRLTQSRSRCRSCCRSPRRCGILRFG